MIEEIEYLNNPDVVYAVIDTINENLEIPKPHDVFSYFTTGHCNIYGEILVNIFVDSAIPYFSYTEIHVLTKIGNYYYDVCGLYREKLDTFEKISKSQLKELPDFGYGNFTKGIDDKLFNEGIKIGRDKLEEILDYKKRHKGSR